MPKDACIGQFGVTQGVKYMRHYRTLFLNNSEDSRKAEEILKQKKIHFSPALVDRSSTEFTERDLPLLITDEGQWRGLASIQRYAVDPRTGKR